MCDTISMKVLVVGVISKENRHKSWKSKQLTRCLGLVGFHISQFSVSGPDESFRTISISVFVKTKVWSFDLITIWAGKTFEHLINKCSMVCNHWLQDLNSVSDLSFTISIYRESKKKELAVCDVIYIKLAMWWLRMIINDFRVVRKNHQYFFCWDSS